MRGVAKQHIFLLGDEPGVREVAKRILEGAGIKVTCFADPTTCLVRLRSQHCHLLITDLKMPGMDSIELSMKVKRLAPWIPVLMISGYGDIPTAVRAIRAGVVDFIEKPLDKTMFMRKVESILPTDGFTDPDLGKPSTPAETNVLRLALDGKSSKEIAKLLHRSTRTVDGHRSNLMRKLDIDNPIDLAKRVAAMELIDMTGKLDPGE